MMNNNILSKLKKLKKIKEDQYQALCPAHNDTKPSLSIKIKNNKILLCCHAGCKAKDIVKKLGLKMTDLNDAYTIQKTMRQCDTKNSDSPEVTLKQYSKYKKLPVKFLEKKVGASIGTFNGKECVEFPYFDTDGNIVAKRLRIALKDTDKFRWDKGNKPCLYGLNRLSKTKKSFIFLVEGESDCHTLWYCEYPALGVPGVTNWNEDRDAPYFDVFKTVYVIYEQDQGSDKLMATLKDSAIASKLKVVTLGKHKDISEMFIDAKKRFKNAFKTQFKKRLRKALKKAVPMKDFIDHAIQEKRAELFAKCQDIAENKDILSLFYRDLQECGVVGEKKYAKTVFLCLNTRFFEKIVSVIVRGSSSSGKSYLIVKILENFFPTFVCHVMTSMSPKALYYTDKEFKHRFIWIFEQAGINSKDLNYQIRTLISEGCLNYEATIKGEDGHFTTQKMKKEGPTGFIVTTTKVTYNEENENRCLTITTDDSAEQSRRVVKAIASDKNYDIDTTRWIAFHEWLEFSEHNVEVPYSWALSDLIDSRSTRIRRDFAKILSLIKSHALLHQSTRRNNSKGSVLADFSDYTAVRSLINESLSASLQKTVPDHIKETVDAVKEIIKKGKGLSVESLGVTILELSQRLKLSKSQALRRVEESENLGYLENLEARPKAKKRLVINEQMPKDHKLLPSVKRLKEHFKNFQKKK